MEDTFGPLSEQELVDRARAYVEQARSPETRRAYVGDLASVRRVVP